MRHGWNLDHEAWRSLQNIMKDYDWHRAPLETLYKSKVPESRGVYMICGCPKDIPVRGQVMNKLTSVPTISRIKSIAWGKAKARFCSGCW